MDEPNGSGQPPPSQDYSNMQVPESMGGPPASGSVPPPLITPPTNHSVGNQPTVLPGKPTGEPEIPPVATSKFKTYILITILILLFFAAILVFASWKGWVPWGAGLWKKNGGPSSSPGATASPMQTTDETRKKDLALIGEALEKYKTDSGTYPVSATRVKTSEPGGVIATALVPTYLDSIPDDPFAPTNYYAYKSDGASFDLSAVLESQTDPSGIMEGGLNIYHLRNISNE